MQIQIDYSEIFIDDLLENEVLKEMNLEYKNEASLMSGNLCN